MPWLGHLRASFRALRSKNQDEFVFPSFVRSHIDHRRQRMAHSEVKSHIPLVSDFLDNFLAAEQMNPAEVNDTFVWCYAITSVAAGSETVAIPLRSILYYVLGSKDIYSTLLAELRSSKLSLPVSWKSAQRLPYLYAVVR